MLSVMDAAAAERVLWRSVVEAAAISDPDALRVRVDPTALVRGPTAADSTFVVTLPDGVSYRGLVEHTRVEGAERFVSTGRLGEHPAGEFLFIVDHGRIAGTFGPTGEQRYCLFPTDQPGVQRVTAHPEAKMPWGAGVRPPGQRPNLPRRKTAAAPDEQISPAAATSPPLIDVLMLYTPRVRTVSGSLSNVQLTADLAIQQANQAYADSAVVQKVRLVHLAEVDYFESGVLQTDLDRLTRAADGIMDEAITLRIDYRADLVHLILAFGDQSELGWLNNFSTFNTTWTFSVSSLPYLGNDAFTRAIGSNQGIEHDWVPLNVAMGAFPQYSFGYAFNGNSGPWKTLMSNGNGTRIRRHSNPQLTWDGVPMGQPLTSATPAFAAQSLNNTGPTIAGIADGVIVPPPVISSPVTASGVVGQFFQYQITAANGPQSFGASGLPLGLMIDTQSGLISGTPREAGTYRIDLSATNSGGTGVKVLTLTIDASSDCPVQRVARRLDAWGLKPPQWLGQAEPRVLELCRRFRDDVLRATPAGRELVDLYYQHRIAVMTRLERDPQLMRDAAACLASIVGTLEERPRDGRWMLTSVQRRQVDRLLQQFEQEVDAELIAAIAKTRRWLNEQSRIVGDQ